MPIVIFTAERHLSNFGVGVHTILLDVGRVLGRKTWTLRSVQGTALRQDSLTTKDVNRDLPTFLKLWPIFLTSHRRLIENDGDAVPQPSLLFTCHVENMLEDPDTSFTDRYFVATLNEQCNIEFGESTLQTSILRVDWAFEATGTVGGSDGRTKSDKAAILQFVFEYED